MAKAPQSDQAKLKFDDAGLSALLGGSSVQKTISYRESGIAGSLFAITPSFEKRDTDSIVEFYFRNQVEGHDRRKKIGVWEGAGRKKRKGGISRLAALEKYREWGRIANDHPDLKAYFANLKAASDRTAEEAARLAALEARKGTVQHLLDAYLESKAGSVSHKEMISVFRSVPDEVRNMYAKDVRPEHITKVIAAYLASPARRGGKGNVSNTNASNGKLTTGDKLRRYLNAAFAFGGKADYNPLHQIKSGKVFGITSNPVAMISPFDPRNANPRALSDAEMAALLNEIDQLPEIHRALALAHVYFGGQRIRQLFRIKWADIDERGLTLVDRKGRGKTEITSQHAIPLTPRLKEILSPLYRLNAGAPGPFSLNGKTTVHEDTIGEMFTSLNQKLMDRGEAQHFTGKAIRSSCETYLASRQVSKEHRAWLLSHERTGVQDRHYDLYTYWREKTDALNLWHEYLDGLRRETVV